MRGAQGQVSLVGALPPHHKGAVMMLLFAALTCLAADAATFTVPCHQTSAVNALLYDNGTTFLISGCSGVDASAASSPLVTYFQLRFDMAAPTQAPPSAVSVLAVNSVNVAILILGNSSLSQSVEGLTIIMRNVTNVATPAPSGVSCVTTPTHPWCVPMLIITGIWQLVALQVVGTNVAHLRNTTSMIGVSACAAIEKGVFSISSCSFTGIVGILQIVNAATSPAAIVTGTNISISNASVELLSGVLSSVVYPCILRLSNANISGSQIVLDTINITDRLGYASANAGAPIFVMCYVFNTTLGRATSLSLQHFTVSLQSSAYLCYLSNTTMTHFASLEIVDALMLGGPSSPAIGVLSVVASSTVSSSRVVLQDITAHCSQLSGSCGIVTISTAELLRGFTVRLADSQINSTGSAYLVSVANSALKNGSLMVENTRSERGHSQSLSIALTASSVESAELLLNNVTVVGGSAALYVNVPVVSNTTITMAYCLCSAYFFAYFSETAFYNTTVMVHHPVGTPAATFGMDQSLIRGGSQWTLELPTTTSGQMLFVRNVIISNASTIIVDTGNMTITREASFTDTLFALQSIRLEGTSTLLVRLPKMLERRSPGSATPPVYLSDNVIIGGSRFVVQGFNELMWTTVLWATSSIFQIQLTTIDAGGSMLVCYFEFQNINNASTTTSRGILVYNATITNGGTMRFASLMMRLDLTRATVVGSNAASEMIQLANINARESSTGVIVEDATCIHDVSLFTRCIIIYSAALSAGARFTTRNVSATMFATSQFIALSECSASTGAAFIVAQDSRVVLTYMGGFYPMNREINGVVVVNSVFSSGSTLTILEGALMTATNQSMAPAASTVSVVRLYNTSVVDSNLTLRNVVVDDLCLPDVSSSVQVVNISGASIIALGAAVSLEGILVDCPHASLLQSAVDTSWGGTAVTTQQLILQRIVAARSKTLVMLSGGIMGRGVTVVVSQCEFKDVGVIAAKITSSLSNAAAVAVSFNDATCTASTTNPQQVVSLSASSPSVYYRVTFTRTTVVSPWWGGRPSSGCPTTTTANASAALQCPTVLVSVPSRGNPLTVGIVVDDALIIGDALLFSAAPEVVVNAQVFCSRWGRHVFSVPSWITMYSPHIAGATQLLASNRPAVNVTMYPYSIANTTLSCPLSLRHSSASPSSSPTSCSQSSSLPSESLSRTHSLSLHSVSHVGLTVSQTTSWTVTSALFSLTASSLSRSLSRSQSPSTTLSYDKYPSSTVTITTIDTSSTSNTMRSRSTTLTTSLAETSVSPSSSSCVTMTQETLTATQNRSNSFSGSPLFSVTMSSHDSPSLTLPLDSPSTALVQTGVSVAALTATAGAILSGGAAGAIGEAASLAALSMITCGGQRTWASNTGIQRLVISVFYDLGPVASVWGNLGLFVGVFLVHVLAATVAPRVSSSWTATRLRFPSHSNVVFLFLLPGVMFASVRCLDATVVADVASGAIGLAAGVGALIATVWHTATHVWPVISTISLEADFAAFLPQWCWRYLRAALPTHTWVPHDMRLQHYSMVGAMASRQQLPLQPFFHAHGAVLALISGIPFSTSACVAQFTLVAIWLLVPIWLLINRRLRIFRRPPSNVLSLATFVVSACLIVSTAVHYEGPESTRLGAATAMSVFGYLLTVASVLKLLASLFAVGTERLVRRKHRQPLKCTAASSNNKELCHTSGSTLLLPDSAPLTTTALWMLHQPRVVEGGSELHSHDGNQVRRITSFALLAPNDDITWKHWQLQRQLAVVRLDTQIRSMLDEQLLHTTPTVDAHAALDLLIQRAAIPL